MPSAIGAQTCAPPEHPAFEFQVTQPAEYRGDTVRVPRPAPARFVSIREHPEALVVQFVVDTLGVPDPRSFKVLHSPSGGAADSARVAMAMWRFSPAVRDGCRVPQLVQTDVVR